MNDYLNELKSEYKKTGATRHLRLSGWSELEVRLSPQEFSRRSIFRSFALAFALVLLFISGLGGLVKVSEAAIPGDSLYPVKILSEELVKKVTGDNQVAIDHRAQEIVALSKKEESDRTELERVVVEYVDGVEKETERVVTNQSENEAFQKKLEKHHESFDEAERQNPEVRNEIRSAQEASNQESSKKDD